MLYRWVRACAVVGTQVFRASRKERGPFTQAKARATVWLVRVSEESI